jgi:HD-GYP domain-containing protein (c-di-GMP phosphodiesterase class II)
MADYTEDTQINRLLNTLVREVKDYTEHHLDLIRKLTQIGVALSAEKNIDRLLELIVDEARNFTQADGGTLYITSDDETALQFAIAQNTKLKIRMGGTGDKITWAPVLLKNADGSPNFSNVSAYAANSGKVVNIPDVYDAHGFDFQGTRKFDTDTGYRSQSMLVVPLKNHENDIIGVLQLLNAQETAGGNVVNFSHECQQMTESLASQAAVALSNNRLIRNLENLLNSFIKSIATAVDEKSPYTGGHVKRVAELSVVIAKKINDMTSGPYSGVHFDDKLLEELRMAAWLHDIGKITTPEYVVDKATKLETIYDRVETLKMRFQVIKRDLQLEACRDGISDNADQLKSAPPPYPQAHSVEQLNDAIKHIDDDFNFLVTANTGDEFMGEPMIARIKEIGGRKWTCDGKEMPLLSEDEIYNLTIGRGTLTNEEREIINKHAIVTHKMLAQLPFPKNLKNVPRYAASHHEKLNGTGYPFGYKDADIPLQSRILAIADIFEALTACDRPYRKSKPLSEALKIMSFMVKDGHIDKELFDLFIKEKIYLDYARQELSPQQIDKVDFP